MHNLISYFTFCYEQLGKFKWQSISVLTCYPARWERRGINHRKINTPGYEADTSILSPLVLIDNSVQITFKYSENY